MNKKSVRKLLLSILIVLSCFLAVSCNNEIAPEVIPEENPGVNPGNPDTLEVDPGTRISKFSTRKF